jgi:hypothetical protein
MTYVFGMGDSTVGNVSQVHARLSLFPEPTSFVLFICRPVQQRASDINVWTAINLRLSSHDSPHVSNSKAFSIYVTERALSCFCFFGLSSKKCATFFKTTVSHFISDNVQFKTHRSIILLFQVGEILRLTLTDEHTMRAFEKRFFTETVWN